MVLIKIEAKCTKKRSKRRVRNFFRFLAKMSTFILLSLRLSGVVFSLVSDLAESSLHSLRLSGI
jgi:hypothetical protein